VASTPGRLDDTHLYQREAQSGGKIRYERTNGKGGGFHLTGEYLDLTPFSRLVQVERLHLRNPTPDNHIERRFEPDGTGTLMTMRMTCPFLSSGRFGLLPSQPTWSTGSKRATSDLRPSFREQAPSRSIVSQHTAGCITALPASRDWLFVDMTANRSRDRRTMAVCFGGWSLDAFDALCHPDRAISGAVRPCDPQAASPSSR
jgi:uncharacterized protein YndB with AHSA1/START domain